MKRVAHLSGIVTMGLAALQQLNFNWGSPFSPQYWARPIDLGSKILRIIWFILNLLLLLILDKYLSYLSLFESVELSAG